MNLFHTRIARQRINHRFYFRNGVDGKIPETGMFPNHLLVFCNVDAVDFIFGNKRLYPVIRFTQPADDFAGGLGNGP